jgi:hypothetical protein
MYPHGYTCVVCQGLDLCIWGGILIEDGVYVIVSREESNIEKQRHGEMSNVTDVVID